MKIRIFDDIESVDGRQLENYLQKLPQWRRDKACAYSRIRDKILSAKAYTLLCELLRQEYNINEYPEFVFGPKGKPYLKSTPYIHFNLSHCEKGVICAVDSEPIGCDIECIDQKLDSSLIEHCCNHNESVQITSAADPKEAFATLWTKKEALLKLRGEGLVDDLKGLLEDKEIKNIEFDSKVNRNSGYVYTICRYKPQVTI